MTHQPEAPPPRRKSQHWDELMEREVKSGPFFFYFLSFLLSSAVSLSQSFLPSFLPSHLSPLLSSSCHVSLSAHVTRGGQDLWDQQPVLQQRQEAEGQVLWGRGYVLNEAGSSEP